MSELSSSEEARGTQPGGRQQGKREWLMVTLENLGRGLGNQIKTIVLDPHGRHSRVLSEHAT